MGDKRRSTSVLDGVYGEMAARGDWSSYVELLEQQGFDWLAELDIPRLRRHIAALECPPASPSLRFRVLRELAAKECDIVTLELCRDELRASGDALGALLSGLGALYIIWSTGRAYDRIPATIGTVLGVLGSGAELTPLSRASALSLLGMGVILGPGELNKSREFFLAARAQADLASSNSLRLYSLTGLGYCHLFAGDLPELEVLIFDATPLGEHDSITIAVRSQFDTFLALASIYRGDPEQALEKLDALLCGPEEELLLPIHWLLASCHRLLAVGLRGDTEAVEAQAQEIQRRVVPEQLDFFRAHVHQSMAVASLTSMDQDRALVHAREAARIGDRSASAHQGRVAALLEGRALIETGLELEAIALYESWIPRWEDAGYRLFSATAQLETARVLLDRHRRGEPGARLCDARDRLADAQRSAPLGSPPVALFRPRSFTAALVEGLAEPTSQWEYDG